MTTKPKIGLLVTALLEDDYNKTGHIRPRMHEATAEIARLLAPYGQIVSPGFVEYEPDADKATQVFNAEGVDLIIVLELAYQKGLIPLRTLLRVNAPVLVWNTAADPSPAGKGADFDLIMENSGMAGLPELTSGLLRAGRAFELLTSHMHDPQALKTIGEYAAAAGTARRLEAMRVGVIGHPFEGMTDLMVDYLSLRDEIGPVCWPIEPEKVAQMAVGDRRPASGRVSSRSSAKSTMPARCRSKGSNARRGWRLRCSTRRGSTVSTGLRSLTRCG